MSVEEFIIQLSYFGIFLMMTSVGFLGIFPPSKIVYVIAGYFAQTGALQLSLIILIGGIGHSLGNYFQYELARQKGLKYLLKFKVFPEREIKKLQVVFDKKGAWFLALGKLLDPIKLVICICAGISHMKRVLFLPIVLITSLIWAAIFSSIGFYFGKSLENFGYIGAVIFIFALIVITIFMKYFNSSEIEELSKTKNLNQNSKK